MAEAADQMAAVLAEVTFHNPRPPGLANADARPIRTATEARTELVEHLTTGVDWVCGVEAMAADGVTTFIEIGPGRVLTGLISRIVPDASALATDAPNSPGGLAVP
jgi:[acyl-carrier-protein] S-malonyltransferase